MKPASLIVDRFGGASAVSKIVGVHRTRVYGWLKRGFVPQAHHLTLLREASKRGVPLSAEDLIGVPAPTEAS